jgi:hypothetical protein
MANQNDSRYDVTTDSYDPGWDIFDAFANGGKRQATIRDNQTGKEYTGTGATDQEARDSAWESVRRDQR